MPKTELQKHIERLIKEYGGLRAVARALKIDPGYLCKIRSGEKTGLTDKTLKKLGLRRTETLRPL